jgi:hypothetical protein
VSAKRLRDRTLEDVFGPLHGGPRTPAQARARKVFAWYPFVLFGVCVFLAACWHLWGAFIRHHAGCP